MEHVFTSLNRRQAMLLLTTLTFGGQEGVAAFEHLPEDEAELLKHRAQQLLQVPREKRVPLLVHEIKRRVAAQRGPLVGVDAQTLAALLQGERGALVEVVLRALPATLAEEVRSHLPPLKVRVRREVRPEVLAVVRWRLEAQLERAEGARAPLRMVDVLFLQPRDLYVLSDRLGARALGASLAGLPEEERGAFLEALPPDARQLARAAVAEAAARALAPDDARTLLALHASAGGPPGVLRGAGVQRLARACVAQSPELAARLLERHRGDFGQMLGRWVREERQHPRHGDAGRTELLAELEALVREGVVERPVRPETKKPAARATPVPPPASTSERPARAAGPGLRSGPAPAERPPRQERAPTGLAPAPASSPRREGAGGREMPRVEMPAVSVAPPARSASAGGGPPAPRAPTGQRPAPRLSSGLRPPTGLRPATPGPRPTSAEAGAGGPPESTSPRRDPIAERAARRNGALSSRSPTGAVPPAGPPKGTPSRGGNGPEGGSR